MRPPLAAAGGCFCRWGFGRRGAPSPGSSPGPTSVWAPPTERSFVNSIVSTPPVNGRSSPPQAHGRASAPRRQRLADLAIAVWAASPVNTLAPVADLSAGRLQGLPPARLARLRQAGLPGWIALVADGLSQVRRHPSPRPGQPARLAPTAARAAPPASRWRGGEERLGGRGEHHG